MLGNHRSWGALAWRLAFTLALTLALTMGGAFGSQSARASVLSSREISLPAFQRTAVQKDLPARAIALAGEGRLWIAGQTSIWRWDLHSQQLAAVRLPSLSADPMPASPSATEQATQPLTISQLLVHGGSLFAVAGDRLLQVQGEESLRVLQFENPKPEPTESTASVLTSEGAALYWQVSRAIYRWQAAPHSGDRASAEEPALAAGAVAPTASLEEAQLQAWRPLPKLPAASKSLLMASQARFFFITQNELYAVDLNAKNGEPRLIYKTRYEFTGIGRHADDLLVHTRHTVLQFGTDLALIRTIPVEGDRRLVDMNLSPKLHTYLFHDRLIERHLLEKQQTVFSYLDIGRVHKASDLVSDHSLVAMILDGAPRVFQLEGQW